MTESMCALMTIREWVKKRVAGENVEEEGCNEQRRLGKNKENGIDIV